MQGGGRTRAVQLGPAASGGSFPTGGHDESGRGAHRAAEVRRVQGLAPERLVDPPQIGDGERLLQERGGQAR